MRPIFVSYRRDDTEGEAGRLFDDLVGRFGEDSVFLDVAAIEVGRDFRRAIDDSVSTCGVLLAVIGKGWVDAKNEAGDRRLDDPSDFVRLETASALKRDIPVIPVLVHGARMPRADQLPDDLKELAYRNGVELTHARWRSDLELLITALKPYADPKPITPTPVPIRPLEIDDRNKNTEISTGPGWKSRRALLASIVGAFVLAAGVFWLWPTQSTVPDLTGSTLPEAALKLKAASLIEGSKAYQPDSEKSPDTVLSQAPSPNARVKRGTAVDLVVAKRALVEIPRLRGKSLTDAQKALQDLQLTVGTITREPNSNVAPDAVLSEFPGGGRRVAIGTTIDLVVAQAQVVPPPVATPGAPAPATLADIPALTGKPLSDAVKLLRDSHLAVGKISRQPNPSVAQDTVLSEFPTAGRKVDPGTAVDLVVAQMQAPAPPPKALPNFAGVWQPFAMTLNGVAQPVPSKSLVITQNGATVTLGNRQLQIDPSGIIGYQTFAAHDNKSGHEVATAAEADLVDTLRWRIEGSTLVYEAIFDYKHEYSNHPPGKDVRVMSYRRGAP
jgi:beta-lactam-binding protein with PASTA domain